MAILAIQAGKLLHRLHIPMLREDNVRQGFFERDQFEDVRRHLAPQLRGIVTFAYYTGWRVTSEILPLEWNRVNRTVGTVRLEPGTTKNRRGRLIKFNDLVELRQTMHDQWAMHEALRREGIICPWVFPRKNRKPIKGFQRDDGSRSTCACAPRHRTGRREQRGARMSRDELWRGLAEAADATQDAVEAFKRESTLQTRADADAACHDYVQRLAPVVGEVTAFRYEAILRDFQDAIDRLDATNATLAGLAYLDEADRTLVRRLTDELATAQRAVDAAEADLADALERALARDNEPAEPGGDRSAPPAA